MEALGLGIGVAALANLIGMVKATTRAAEDRPDVAGVESGRGRRKTGRCAI